MTLPPLNIVLCWHMHQPLYREGDQGAFHLPWVYLHGIKDYTDMAQHLENHPQMRTVVNFSPVLLEQIEDYVSELDAFLNHSHGQGTQLSDPLLALLVGSREMPQAANERQQLLTECQRCHAPQMIEPYPAFQQLVESLELAFHPLDEGGFTQDNIAEQDLYDLLVWYHLSWLGQSLRDTETVQQLMQKQRGYTAQDRLWLVSIIYQALVGIIPRYKALADRGQIELSVTPYAHPIVPLLNSFDNMRCSQPDDPGPECINYPGGLQRSQWHLQKGLEIFQRHFGRKADGVWLSEGGVSDDALRMLDEAGIRWTATGEQVWRNTCELVGIRGEDVDNKRKLFSPYQLDGCGTRIYFRDDGLSDFIGFEYSSWDAEDAARDFAGHLTNIADFLGDDVGRHVVSVILDGENAWEYYPQNGSAFLDALYRELTGNERLRLSSFAELSADDSRTESVDTVDVGKLCAGSWVYGSFSTWIGDAEKNRAWEYLVAAKQAYDDAINSKQYSPEQLAELENQLAICEGSDWFWWFGGYNPADSVNDFDRLYRTQLKKLYALIDVEPPPYLDKPISQGSAEPEHAENAGTMRRTA